MNYLRVILISGLSFITAQAGAIDKQCLPNISSGQALLAEFSTTMDDAGTISRYNWRYIRDSNYVAYENKNRDVAELWVRQHNDRLSYARLFLEPQRRIDYTYGDLKALNHTPRWQDVSQPIPSALRKALIKIEDTTYRCLKAERYHNRKGEPSVELIWLPQLALPAWMIKTEGDHKTTLELLTLENAVTAQAQFRQWSNFQSMDFADIGDNESDPFVSKLIDQGFVEHSDSVYSSDGKSLHHQH